MFKFLLCTILWLISFATAAQDLSCYNRIGGTWELGSAPSGCNVSPLVSMPSIKNGYSPVVFDLKIPSRRARSDYMSAMFPVLREAGTYYLRRRNPNVSAGELDGFLQGLYALAHQESFWTHYRDAGDGILRYMRGDSLHGHGLMQVDDRSHVSALKQGKGVDLVYNIIYGLDIYYSAWIRSASAPCVGSSRDYISRARSAWAAYNGGFRAICRWTAGGSTDREYFAKLNSKGWLSFVNDANAPARLDIKCLTEGPRPCATSFMDLVFEPLPLSSVEPTGIQPVFLSSLSAYIYEFARLNSCYSKNCDFPRTDSRSYDYALGRAIQARLEGLAGSGMATDRRARAWANYFLTSDDGWVVEGALKVLARLPPAGSSFIVLKDLLLVTSDAELVPAILRELERYRSIYGGDIESAVAAAVKTGAPFVASVIQLRSRTATLK